MAYECKDNTGRLWPNNKRTSENSPHLSGDGKFNGVKVWLSGWNQQDGGISLAMKPKDGGQQQAPRQQHRPSQGQQAQTPPIFRNPTPKPTTPPEQYPEHKMRDKTYKPVAEPKPDDSFDPDDIPF